MASKKKKSSTRSSRAPRMVYYFGSTKVDGRADQRTLLGGKGANLSEMIRIGLPVPPGFTISTEACSEFYKRNGQEVRRWSQPIAAFCPVWRGRLYAGHDGHRSQSWIE